MIVGNNNFPNSRYAKIKVCHHSLTRDSLITYYANPCVHHIKQNINIVEYESLLEKLIFVKLPIELSMKRELLN